MGNDRFQFGYTLVELLTVIVILAIIATIAIGGFLPQLRRMEAQRLENDLSNFIINGKQSALIYQNTVTLCVANDNKVCVSQGGNYLLTFIDKNNNHQFESRTDTLLDTQQPTLRFGKLMTRVALNKNYIEINPTTGNPIGYMGHIKYCPTNGEVGNMFKVTFSITGVTKIKYHKNDPTDC